MHSTIDNIKFTLGNDANEVVNELFESLRSKVISFLIQSNLCITNVIK